MSINKETTTLASIFAQEQLPLTCCWVGIVVTGLRDKIVLQELWDSNKAPWKIW